VSCVLGTQRRSPGTSQARMSYETLDIPVVRRRWNRAQAASLSTHGPWVMQMRTWQMASIRVSMRGGMRRHTCKDVIEIAATRGGRALPNPRVRARQERRSHLVPETLPSEWLLSRGGRGLRPPPVPCTHGRCRSATDGCLVDSVSGRSGRRLATSRSHREVPACSRTYAGGHMRDTRR